MISFKKSQASNHKFIENDLFSVTEHLQQILYLKHQAQLLFSRPLKFSCRDNILPVKRQTKHKEPEKGVIQVQGRSKTMG